MVPIHGYPNYAINTSGDVYNTVKGKLMRKYTNSRGYVSVTLYNNGHSKSFPVHRLMLTTFKPVSNQDELSVDHVNGDKGDNRLENLEWVTIRENTQRYHNMRRLRNLNFDCREIMVYNTITDEVSIYKNYYHAHRGEGGSRYLYLDRASDGNDNKVYPDGKMVKFNNGKPFTIPTREEILRSRRARGVLVKDHSTGVISTFATSREASEFIGVSESYLHHITNHEETKIFKSGHEVRSVFSHTPFQSLSRFELNAIISSIPSGRRIEIVDTYTGYSFKFNSCRDGAEFLKISPTLMNYRMKYNQYRPDPNGFIYAYLS